MRSCVEEGRAGAAHLGLLLDTAICPIDQMPDRTLLSIDDDPQILELIRKIALALGYQVETVTNGGAFMTTYVRTRPSVVTVDICMPIVDGIELLRWLGDVESKAKVIIMSGAHPPYAEMARKLAQAGGAMDVSILRKPFRIADLRQALAIQEIGGQAPDPAPRAAQATLGS